MPNYSTDLVYKVVLQIRKFDIMSIIVNVSIRRGDLVQLDGSHLVRLLFPNIMPIVPVQVDVAILIPLRLY